MSFGTTFVDGAAEMEGEEGHSDSDDGLLTGVEPAPIDAFHFSAPWNKGFGPDPRIEAHAVNKAHAAYRDASAGSHPPPPPAMNVVITLGDAARTFVYRGLNALAEKLKILAQRVSPDR